MKKEDIKELLGKLVDVQANGCAPIELSIGGISNEGTVLSDCVMIKSAPPIVSTKLQEWGYNADITRLGVIVTKF